MNYKKYVLKEYCPSHVWIEQKIKEWEDKFPPEEGYPLDPLLQETIAEKLAVERVSEAQWSMLYQKGYRFNGSKRGGHDLILRKRGSDEVVMIKDLLTKEGEIA